MNNKFKNILLRASTGLVFIITVIFGVRYNMFTANILLSVILIIGTAEITKAFSNKGEVFKLLSVIISFLIFDAIILSFQFNNQILLYALPILISTPLLFELFLSKNSTNSLQKLGNTYISIAYPLFGVIGMYLVLFKTTEGGVIFQPMYLITIFVAIWLNDTFAYLTGMFFGRTKLFERVSPNKTWEGTFGGVIISLVLTNLFIQNFVQSEISSTYWSIIIIITVITGNIGDLIESILKRKLEIKDSGKILPGHGGILDRFDSIFFAAPFVAVLIKILDYL